MLKFSVPDGYQFRPTTDQIFSLFLVPIVVYGDPLPPDGPFLSLEIYGENKEPWKIFDKDSIGSFWVFTRLRKKSKSRIDRTAGCGCWLARSMKEIHDNHGRLLGFDKYFTFTAKNVGESKGKGHWIMHEFSLVQEDKSDQVICVIKNKDVTDSDLKLKSNKGITVNTKPPNDKEMKSVPKSPADHDHGDTNDCHTSKQNRSLNSKSNDEDTRSIAESSNQQDLNDSLTSEPNDDEETTTMLLPDLNDNAIHEIRNTDAASLDRKLNTKRTGKQTMNDEEKKSPDDEEMESILKSSPNREDHRNANDDPNAASDEIDKVDKIIIEGHSDEEIKQNSELFGDVNSHHVKGQRRQSGITNGPLLHVLRNFINEADKFDCEIVLEALENGMGADSATFDLDLEGESPPPMTEMVNCEDTIGFLD